jgi:hypothetical protein
MPKLVQLSQIQWYQQDKQMYNFNIPSLPMSLIHIVATMTKLQFRITL